jgi:hypothetical protein
MRARERRHNDAGDYAALVNHSEADDERGMPAKTATQWVRSIRTARESVMPLNEKQHEGKLKSR